MCHAIFEIYSRKKMYFFIWNSNLPWNSVFLFAKSCDTMPGRVLMLIMSLWKWHIPFLPLWYLFSPFNPQILRVLPYSLELQEWPCFQATSLNIWHDTLVKDFPQLWNLYTLYGLSLYLSFVTYKIWLMVLHRVMTKIKKSYVQVSHTGT